jgi:hypothetical protein
VYLIVIQNIRVCVFDIYTGETCVYMIVIQKSRVCVFDIYSGESCVCI